MTSPALDHRFRAAIEETLELPEHTVIAVPAAAEDVLREHLPRLLN